MKENPYAQRIYKAVGAAIATARENAANVDGKLTQKRLAELTDGALSRSAIANIERGRQRIAIHHLFRIAEALRVSPADLLPPFDPNVDVPDLPPESELRDDPEGREFLEKVLTSPAALRRRSHATGKSDRAKSQSATSKVRRQ